MLDYISGYKSKSATLESQNTYDYILSEYFGNISALLLCLPSDNKYRFQCYIWLLLDLCWSIRISKLHKQKVLLKHGLKENHIEQKMLQKSKNYWNFCLTRAEIS